MNDEAQPLGPIRQLDKPAAFGDRRRSLRLIWVLAKTEVRQRYANALLGYLWTILEPVLLFAVLYWILKRVIVFGAEIENYGPFLLMNIILYYFFRHATTRGFRTIRSKGGNLIRKMEFPRVVLPISVVVATGLIYLGVIPVFFGYMLFTGVDPMWTWALFPLILAALFVLACGTTLLLAAIYVRIADLEYIWLPLIRIQFWITPVLFSIATIPDLRFREVILANPLSLILNQAQIWMINPEAPSVSEVAGSSGPVIVGLLLAVGVCLAGPIAFAGAARRVAEQV